jgi:hypothetical protein
MKKIDNRLFVIPKYKVGDVIVYKVDSDGPCETITQSKITTANGLIELDDKKDTLKWFYHVEHEDDAIYDAVEEDILYKLY